MKLPLRSQCKLVLGLLIALPLFVSPAAAQEVKEKKKSEQEEKTDQKSEKASPTKTFNQIKELIKEGEWEDAAKWMTKEAADSVTSEVVLRAASLSQIDVMIPGIEDAKDDVAEVLEEYGLDKIKFDMPQAIELSVDGDGGEDEEPEDDGDNDSKKVVIDMKKHQKEILAILKKSGKRWDAVRDLWETMESTPFSMDPLSGKVEEVEIDGDSASLKVKLVPNLGGDEGISIQIVAPPTFLQFTKSGNIWKYSGLDQERTRKAQKEFMKKQKFRAPGRGADF